MFFGIFGGICFVREFVTLYRIRVFDRGRGIVKFAATNPQYTKLVMDMLMTSDESLDGI